MISSDTRSRLTNWLSSERSVPRTEGIEHLDSQLKRLQSTVCSSGVSLCRRCCQRDSSGSHVGLWLGTGEIKIPSGWSVRLCSAPGTVCGCSKGALALWQKQKQLSANSVLPQSWPPAWWVRGESHLRSLGWVIAAPAALSRGLEDTDHGAGTPGSIADLLSDLGSIVFSKVVGAAPGHLQNMSLIVQFNRALDPRPRRSSRILGRRNSCCFQFTKCSHTQR